MGKIWRLVGYEKVIIKGFIELGFNQKVSVFNAWVLLIYPMSSEWEKQDKVFKSGLSTYCGEQLSKHLLSPILNICPSLILVLFEQGYKSRLILKFQCYLINCFPHFTDVLFNIFNTLLFSSWSIFQSEIALCFRWNFFFN